MKQTTTQRVQEIRLLANDDEVLNEAADIIGEELAQLNRYSRFCYTPSEIGKTLGMDGRDLNSFLSDRGVIRWTRGRWYLTKKYQHLDLTEDRYRYIHGADGSLKLVSSLVWTEKGKQFILNCLIGG